MIMNKVNQIECYTSKKVNKDQTPNKEPSYEKGQVIEGVISEVSDQVAIDFCGNKVNIQKDSLSDPKKGQIRRFEVVDVSNQKLTLKEIPGVHDTNNPTQGTMTGVMVDSSAQTIFESQSEPSEEEETSSASDVSNQMSEEDYETLKEEGISLKTYSMERLQRALLRVQMQKQLKKVQVRETVDQLKQDRQQMREMIKGQYTQYPGMEPVIEHLLMADLPITKDNVQAMAVSLSMSQAVYQMNPSAHSYLIQNELDPTIDNIYKAVHSGQKEQTIATKEIYQEVESTIQAMIKEAGFQDVTDAKQTAQWLFMSGLGVTPENILYKQSLQTLGEDLTEDQIAQLAAHSMKQGIDPKQTNLFTMKRQVEELRLKLSYEAAALMEKKGIHIDLSDMAEGVEHLKQLEDAYYKQLMSEVSDQDFSHTELLKHSIEAVQSIRDSSTELLAYTFSTRHTISLEQLSANAQNYQVSALNQVENAYEALMTAPRADMGDSIQKAFQNIDSLLEGMNLKITQENQRAVRMLAHNQIPLTQETISGMKAYDKKVNQLIINMTPRVTASMIRDHINPLSMSVDDLTQLAQEYKKELGDSQETKYSEFLVQLDQKKEITQEERDVYISVYRLLHQIEQSDGAAIGALVKSGKDLTLKNLLTEVRSRKDRNMDLSVDDTTDVKHHTGYHNSITEPIDSYYAEETQYQKALFNQIVNETEVLPSYPFNANEMYDKTMEELAEEMEKNIRLKDTKKILEQFEEVAKDSVDYEKFLQSMNQEDSLANINALKYQMEGSNSFYPKEYEKKIRDHEKRLFHALGKKNEFVTTYKEYTQEMQQTISDEIFETPSDSKTIQNLTAMLDVYSLNQKLSEREFYNIPIEDHGEILTMNLTIIHNSADKGRIRVHLPGTSLGDISVQASMSKEKAQIFITSDSTKTTESIKQQENVLRQSLLNLGYSDIHINYDTTTKTASHYIFATGQIYKEAQKELSSVSQTEPIDTDTLYETSKEIVNYLTTLI